MSVQAVLQRVGPWGALAILVVASGILWLSTRSNRFSPPAPSAELRDYVDIETHQTFRLPASEIPPLLGSTGKPTLVEAHYTPGPDGTPRLAYYLKYSDRAKAAREKARDGLPFDVAEIEEDALVCAPVPDSPWVSISSSQGRALTASAK